MNLVPRFPRWIASAAMMAGVLGLAVLSARSGLGPQTPGSKDPKLPDDLLKARPFDRLTLPDNSVWLIEPVYPRPLPVFDPEVEKQKKKANSKKAAAKAKEIAAKGNVGVDKKEKDAPKPKD